MAFGTEIVTEQKIAENAVKSIARPAYLCRGTFQAIFKSGYNQNLCGCKIT